MTRYVEGWNRGQSFLLPESVDDYVGEDNPVRVADAFVDELDLAELGFNRATPADTSRPGYHPATLLKLYLYGYLNRVPSSRRLEREAHRNLEVLWLTGRLAPDFKTIADFRRDNGPAIKATCRQFVLLCRRLDLFSDGTVAIDGSKYEAVNARDKTYSQSVIQRRMEQIAASVARYLEALDTANRVDENGMTLRHYWTTKCPECPIKAQCTPAKMRRVTRWEHEGVLDAMQQRLDQVSHAMLLRRQTVEHPFGTIKAWMGATHFLTRTLKRVGTEMSLQVLAYNMKRVIAILGVRPLMEAIRA